MKNIVLLVAGITILLVSCLNKKMETMNSPLVTVIKLNAAEALLDFTEAKNTVANTYVCILAYRDTMTGKFTSRNGTVVLIR
jgi:protein involved in sex pheromone biosynthesis